MNVFYKDSLFKVTPTNYIAMTTSQNRGESWEQFKLLPPFLGENIMELTYVPDKV